MLFALVFLFYVEDWLNLKPRYMLFRISVDRAENMVTDVHRIFAELKVGIDNFQVSLSGEKNLIQFDAEVSTHQQEKILKALCKPGDELRNDARGTAKRMRSRGISTRGGGVQAAGDGRGSAKAASA